jgi:tRNA(adenine34) deaminase
VTNDPDLRLGVPDAGLPSDGGDADGATSERPALPDVSPLESFLHEAEPAGLKSGPPEVELVDPVDAAWMERALMLARAAAALGEVPVGCIVVQGTEVLAESHNLRESLQDPTAHAELLALRDAARKTGSWRLSEATVYVTLEPCPMCAGALVNARVKRVVFGALDPKAGATSTLYNIGRDTRLNHRFELAVGVRGSDCGALLSQFFAQIRKKSRQAPTS